MQWSLTTEYSDHNDFTYISKVSTKLLIPRHPLYQDLIYQSKVFQDFIHNFFNLSSSYISFYVSNFESIFKAYLSYTNGRCLFKMPTLSDDLINHLNILPARELFLYIVQIYDSILDKPFCNYLFIIEKLQNGGELAESIIMLLIEFKKHSMFQTIPQYYNELVSSLLQYGINLNNSTFSRINSFEIIESIKNSLLSNNYDIFEIQVLIDYYGKLYEPNLSNDKKIVKIAAFSIFDIFLSQAYQLFLTEPKNSFLAQTVLMGIRKLDDISLKRFVDNHSIINFLINHNFDEDKITGQFIELALHLYRRNICSNPEWVQLIQQKVLPKLFIMAQSYGGF